MIAAGVNAKALSTYMGHANISITLDRYGHLMPGTEEEAAGLLDAYLEPSARLRRSGRGLRSRNTRFAWKAAASAGASAFRGA